MKGGESVNRARMPKLFWIAASLLCAAGLACSAGEGAPFDQDEDDQPNATEDSGATTVNETGGTAGAAPVGTDAQGGVGGEEGGVKRDAGARPPIIPRPMADGGMQADASLPPADAKPNTIPSAVCTQIIGMSVTAQWSLLPGTFERAVNNEAWQMLIRTGRGVGAWADPNFDGWALPVQSPCGRNSGAPDRVLFEVLSAEGFRGETDASVIENQIEAMVITLRRKLPSVKTIVLQPVIGGPQGKPCPRGAGFVMASLVHPAAVLAISRVVQNDRTGSLFMSFIPTVRSCDDYIVETGNPGHLVRESRPGIAQMMADALGKL